VVVFALPSKDYCPFLRVCIWRAQFSNPNKFVYHRSAQAQPHSYGHLPGRRNVRTLPPLLCHASAKDGNGQEIAAVRGCPGFRFIHDRARHNSRWSRYRSCRRVLPQRPVSRIQNQRRRAPELLSQFPILEEALEAMGVRVWPMIYYEADDALASAASKAAKDDRVNQVFICTPDKISASAWSAPESSSLIADRISCAMKPEL